MILVTGGAGFIGSNLQAALYEAGREVIVSDHLGTADKWQNLRKHPPLKVIPPAGLAEFLAGAPRLEAVVHLGAISETTATDGDLVWQNNVTFSQTLWTWCAEHEVRFIYASSAATYGDGAQGFDDDCTTSALRRLRPLNLYGWSKHAFDLWVARQIETRSPAPPDWAGMKFFNVFGPNEYHKGQMISVVKVKHDEIAAGGAARLFRSTEPDLPDGAQARDFIWIDDVIAAINFMLTAPSLHGLFNLGTGAARSYAELAAAVCAAHGVPARIEYIDMPAALQGKYQNFTQARMDRLRAAGFNAPFTSLEDGVRHYIKNYLTQPDIYR